MTSGTTRSGHLGSLRSTKAVCILGVALVGALALMSPSTARAIDDTTPPELVDFSFSPASVDTSAGACHDQRHGPGDRRPGGSDRHRCGLQRALSGQGTFTTLARTSGTALDGVWQGTLTVPQFAEQGTWSLGLRRVARRRRQQENLTRSEIAAAGWPTSFEQTGADDLVAPELVDFSFSPASVDTSAGACHDQRHGPGHRRPGGSDRHRCGLQRALWRPQGTFTTLARISGTALDGVWQGTLTVPQFAEQGTWSLGLRRVA